MTFKQFFILLLLATVALTGGWGWTLFSIDPLSTNWLGFLLFYLTLFLAATGWLCIIGVSLRRWRQPQMMLYHVVARSFRQSIALSFLLVVLLVLQGLHWLRWWNVLPIVLVVTLAESLVLRRNHKREEKSARVPLHLPQEGEDEPIQPLFMRKELHDEEGQHEV